MYELSVLIPPAKDEAEAREQQEQLKQARKACPKLGQVIITNALGTRYMCETENDESQKLTGLKSCVKVEAREKKVIEEITSR